MWQAVIRNNINAEIAKKAGDAHETHFPDLTKRNFGDLGEADLTIDLLNNEIGRRIANANPDAITKELGILTLVHFKKKVLWTAEKVGDNIKISKTKISDN